MSCLEHESMSAQNYSSTVMNEVDVDSDFHALQLHNKFN